jgi:hypothetical protein
MIRSGVLYMIKRRAKAAAPPLLQLLPYFSRDEDYGLPIEHLRSADIRPPLCGDIDAQPISFSCGLRRLRVLAEPDRSHSFLFGSIC